MPASVYSESEEKLLRPALCPNAAFGEKKGAGHGINGSLMAKPLACKTVLESSFSKAMKAREFLRKMALDEPRYQEEQRSRSYN